MKPHKPITIFGSGFAVGTLGGLIGLGGAEFRLPLLIGLFGFNALSAVILNKAISLVVVASSLPFRAGAVPLASILGRWDVILTLLAGSLPTMLVGFTRYSQDQSFGVIRAQRHFLLVMAAGSLLGAFVGGRLLGIIPSAALLPILAAILVVSSIKVWGHA